MTGKQTNMAAADAANGTKVRSAYFKGLDMKFQHWYVGKIDPYLLKKKDFSYSLEALPSIEFPDVCNYILLETSFYTNKQMKAYKSLEAFNYFVCGWVEELGVIRLGNDNRLIYAIVSVDQCFAYRMC